MRQRQDLIELYRDHHRGGDRPGRIDAWLDPARTRTRPRLRVLDGIVLAPLDVRPVSRKVNRVGPNGADLIEPVDAHADQPIQLALTGRAA